MNAQSSRCWMKILTFYVLTLLFSAPFYASIISAGMQAGGGTLAIGLMWCPGVAALATKSLFRESARELGWGWGQTRYVLWAYLIPILYSLPLYLLVWSTGLGGVPNQEFVAEMTRTFGWDGVSTPMFLFGYVALAATLGLVWKTGSLGEEIGWRGFLVPELGRVVGFRSVGFISGLMWAGWRYPILIFGNYNSGTPIWFELGCFTVMVVATSFILAKLTFRSGSLWPAVTFHASHNAFVQAIFTPLTVDTGVTRYVVDEFGIGLAATATITAVVVCRKMDATSDGLRA